jgi:uncharacterized membrane protein YhaH (DUF805 family)
MDKALLPLQRYFDFAGRSSRTEYFAFSIALTIAYVFLFVIAAVSAAGQPGEGPGPMGMLAIGLVFVVAIGTIVPSVAVTVRRLHDQDRSGWMALLGFVPYVGGLILLVLMFLGGTDGPNRYGQDPR